MTREEVKLIQRNREYILGHETRANNEIRRAILKSADTKSIEIYIHADDTLTRLVCDHFRSKEFTVTPKSDSRITYIISWE
jgi:hypothetical protein